MGAIASAEPQRIRLYDKVTLAPLRGGADHAQCDLLVHRAGTSQIRQRMRASSATKTTVYGKKIDAVPGAIYVNTSAAMDLCVCNDRCERALVRVNSAAGLDSRTLSDGL